MGSIKILGLSTSTRKMGNTEIALKIALDAARSAGADVDLFNLNDLNHTKKIEACNGCIHCFRDKENECIFEDSIAEFQKVLFGYDGIVLGSPCYTKFPPSILRQILDRGFMFEIYNRTVKPKPTFVFTTEALEAGTFYDNSLTLPSVIQFAEMFQLKPHIKKVIKAGYMPGELLKNQKNIDYLEWAGKELVQIIREGRKRELDQLQSIEVPELCCPVCDSNVFRLEKVEGDVNRIHPDGTVLESLAKDYHGIKYCCPFCDGFILDYGNKKIFYKGKFYTNTFLDDHYRSVIDRASFDRLRDTLALRTKYNNTNLGIKFLNFQELISKNSNLVKL